MSLRIDVAKSFERVDSIPITQPPDYTDFPSGDNRVYALGTSHAGVIPQEGLKKRLADTHVLTAELGKSQNWVANGNVNVKPVKNVGILSAVDQFFNWLNRMLGEK